MKRLKLCASVPGLADGTSWWRGALPLLDLCHQHDELEIKFFDASSKPDWPQTWDGHLAFLQRPFSPTDAEFLGVNQLGGVKTIADWDDNFAEISESNPVYDLYNTPNVLACVRGIKKHVDRAWTTTEHLRDCIDSEAGSKKTTVIPNAWPDRWFPKFAAPSENSILYWRGGSSHLQDLLEFAEGFRKISGKFPLWNFLIAGDTAWPLREKIPKERRDYRAWAPGPLFAKQMQTDNPAVTLVPLQDTTFNRSKSNISAIEAFASGSLPIAPDFPEFRFPGIVNYKSKDDFVAVVSRVLSMPRKERSQLIRDGQQYITENLMLSKVNELRWKTITELL